MAYASWVHSEELQSWHENPTNLLQLAPSEGVEIDKLNLSNEKEESKNGIEESNEDWDKGGKSQRKSGITYMSYSYLY